jgi:organic hydroperoxide reductase OsmC/OhrA
MKHAYKLDMVWIGNKNFTVNAPGKTELVGSADPNYKGDPTKWNPEEMLLASLSSCHMLWYLHLLGMNKIVCTSYSDTPTATLEVDAKGEGKMSEATMNPVVVLADPSRIEDAKKLHEMAHHKCFIVKSVNFPVSVNPQVR